MNVSAQLMGHLFALHSKFPRRDKVELICVHTTRLHENGLSLLFRNLVNIISSLTPFSFGKGAKWIVDNPISLMPQENTCRVKVMGEKDLNISLALTGDLQLKSL